MPDTLRILIQASLNKATSITEINKAIKELSNNPSLQKIKVNVEIDSKILEVLSNFNKNINQITQSTLSQSNAMKDTIKTISQETQAVKDATEAQKRWNLERKKTVSDAQNNVKRVTETFGDGVNQQIKDTKFVSGGVVQTTTDIINQKKMLEEEKKIDAERVRNANETNKIRKALADKATQDENKRYNDFVAIKRAEYEALKKAKADAAALLAAQNKAEVDVLSLNRRYGTNGSNVDNAALNNYLSQIKALTPATSNFREEAARLTNEINKIGASAKVSSGHTLALGEALKSSLVKMTAFIVGGSLISAPFQFIREGITYVNELNKSLTELSIVYLKNQGEVAKYGEEFHKMGMEMGVATQELAKGAVEFARQGLSPEETAKRMASAIQYAKISSIDFTSSAKILTATVNSMGVDINRASDVFSAIGDSAATSASEVGEAMQRVGGSANSIGLEFEKVSSWIGQLSSSTRESSFTIGNSIKSIIARVQSLKEKGFDEEDGTKINQVSKALAEVGIRLVDEKGNFRNFGTVMDELGAKWGTLTSRQKAYISTTTAGSFQSSRFMNLMEGYSDSVKLYDIALTSAGISQKKFNLYQDGTEAKLTKLKNAFTGIFQSSFKSDEIGSLIQSLTSLTLCIDKVVKTVGLIPPVMFLATTAFLVFNTAMRASIATFAGGKLFTALATAGMQIQALSIFTTAYTGSAIAARVATIGLQVALTGGIALAVAAVTVGISKLVERHQQLAEQQKQLEDQQKKIATNWTNQKDKITELVAEYTKLDNATNNGKSFSDTAQQEKYYEVSKNLADLLPNLVHHIDEKGFAHLRSADAISKELVNTEKLTKLQNAKDLATANDDFKKILNDRRVLQSQLNTINRDIERGYSTATAGGKDYKVKTYSAAEIATLRLQAEAIGSQLESSTDSIHAKFSGLVGVLVQISGVKFGDDAKNQLSKFVENMDISQLSSDDLVKKLVQISSIMNRIKEIQSTDGLDKNDSLSMMSTQTDLLATSLNATSSQAKKFVNVMNGVKPSVDKSNELFENLNDTQKALQQQFEQTAESVKPLNDAIDTLNKEHQLSSSSIMELIKKYPELYDKISTENGQLVITKEAIESVRNAKLNELEVSIQSQKAQVDTQEQALVSKLAAYGVEIDAISNVAEAKKSLAEAEKNLNDSFNPNGSEMEQKGKLQDLGTLSNQILQIAKTKEALKALQDAAKTGFNFKNSTNTEKPKNEKEDTQANLHILTDFSKEEIDNINNVIKARDLNIKSLEKQVEVAKKTGNINVELELSNKLLIEQKAKLEDIATANSNLKKSADSVRDTYQSLSDQFSKGGVGFDAWFNDDASASSKYIEAIHAIEKSMQNIEGDGKNLSDTDKNRIKELENQRELYQKIFNQIQGIKQSWSGNLDEIQKVKDSIEGISGDISNVFKSEIDKVMDAASKAIDVTIDKLKKKLEANPNDNVILNTKDLTISIDEILAKLDEADGRYPNGFQVIDTSSDARAKLDNYKNTLLGLSNVISEMSKESSNNASQTKANIEKQIAFSQDLKSQIASMKQYISSMTTMYQQQEASISNQIKLHQKQYDLIIENLKKQLEIQDTFNMDEFSDSIDSIISDLNSLDGVYGKGNFIESTLGTREELDAFKAKIQDIAKAVSDYQNAAGNPSQNSIQNEIAFVNGLKLKIDGLNNTLRDTELQYKNEEKALENLITTQTKYYDDQIAAQQLALKNLDEQIEKEDRLKKLQDINDEISKTKADKRFSYIGADGNETLTFDKGKVGELEKQRDELLKQYQRDDLKKAIQDNIDTLEKAKQETIKKLQDQLDKTKQIHQIELDVQRLYIQNMQNLYQIAVNDVNGKIDKLKSSYDKEITNEQDRLTQLQAVHQQELASMNMYVGYLSSLDATLVANTQAKIDTLKIQLETERTNMINHWIDLNDITKTGSKKFNELVDEWNKSAISKLDSMVSGANARLIQMQQIMAAMSAMSGGGGGSSSSSSGSSPTIKYHTGTNSVGSAPLAENEMPAILKLGETVLTKMQSLKLQDIMIKPLDYLSGLISSVKLPSFNQSSKNTSNATTYSLSGVTIMANNPSELFEGIQNLVKSHHT
ncbi:phage tail tape measure protein [Paenibacillus ferrarius]|uniref:Phage tail tape measure protein n=1 Tax=Paenibacillus ferrarius TaxID=1469647 RepID=A0A1V4H938_9BACL|nr:phage tail tape measure protein [Paenibacillus ferrarius]OPH47626.1 phage tail tape measure protein [Paenibacillus ferrarius]